jgi:hypothetical protein
MKKFIGKVGLVSMFILFSVTCGVAAELPGVSVGSLSEVFDDVKLGMSVSTFYRVDRDPYFGASGVATHGVDQKNANWGELSARFALGATKKLDWAEVSALVGGYYATTAGQDVYGGGPDSSMTGLDKAWIEFANIKDSSVSLKVGRQDIQIEKWFQVGSSQDQGTAFWLMDRASFPFAVRLDATLGSVQTTAFYARAGGLRQAGDTDLVGLNAHLDISEDTYVYGGVFNKFDREADDSVVSYSLGGETTVLDNLTLETEIGIQTGDDGVNNLDRDAYAGFAAATYAFPVAKSPYIRGMYAIYSGDDNPADGDQGNWDQMFDHFAGWNRWIQGEQTGEIWLANTNKKIAIVELGFSPTESTTISLHYLNHTIDENVAFGTTSDDWADEVNVFVDTGLGDHVFLSLGAGASIPGDAAKEVTGGDDTAYFGQALMMFYL